MDQARSDELVAGEAARRRLRRTVDATTLAQLAILVVVWAGGAVLIHFVAGLVRPSTGLDPMTVVYGWTATGVLVFVPPVEKVLARMVLGLRRPTPEQEAYFAHAWAQVCRQAGVRSDRYVLRVEWSQWLNAVAGAGHIVGVTATALTLPTRHLEAVLAHELGHHLGGHAMIGLLHAWYSWPLRLLVRLSMWIGRGASVAMAIVRPFAPMLALAILPLAFVSCLGSLLVPLIALPVWLSTIVMRRSELRADGTAVRLGYGPELLWLCRGWAAREQPPSRGWRSVRNFVRDTHPRFDVRVRAIERALTRIGPAGPGGPPSTGSR
jgi:Zn-dependent protease with chaperone function